MNHLLKLTAIGVVLSLTAASQAQNLRVPASVNAGEEASIVSTGSGRAQLYIVGPGVSSKRDISLGEEIRLPSSHLRNAGKYLAIACSDTCTSQVFYVTAAKPSKLTLLVHPSRVPVGQSDAVSGVTLPFDQFHNLVITPLPVNFQLTAAKGTLMSRSVRTQDGVAWFRTNSGPAAGLLQVTAGINELSVKGAVQQVASEPCNLRIKGERTAKAIVVETEPVHDCSGNPLPDGTIVTFTAADGNRRSTVDAPIKQGVARAQMTASGPTVVSVASGVVMGNELHLGAQP
jgi:hypothetical protein